MPGFSLTLLLLPRDGSSQNIISLLDEPATTPGWTSFPTVPPQGSAQPSPRSEQETSAASTRATRVPAENPKVFDQAIRSACQGIISAEPEITRMDQIGGDGDCGLTLKAGANGQSLHPLRGPCPAASQCFFSVRLQVYCKN